LPSAARGKIRLADDYRRSPLARQLSSLAAAIQKISTNTTATPI
jgi:hypothetical protein